MGSEMCIRDSRGVKSEIAAVHQEVLSHREVRIEIIGLGHNASTLADSFSPLIDILTEDFKHASRAGRLTEQHAQCGGFPGPVWTEQAKAASGLDIKAEISNGDHVAERFSNFATVNDWRRTGLISHVRGQW